MANFSCSAVSTAANSPIGPYLTVASATASILWRLVLWAGPVENGMQFDTSTLGPHYFTVQVQDSATNTNSQTVTYNVVAPPSISEPSSATFALGSAGSVAISDTGFPVPILSESGALPAGVTFVDKKNGTAILAGTPT